MNGLFSPSLSRPLAALLGLALAACSGPAEHRVPPPESRPATAFPVRPEPPPGPPAAADPARAAAETQEAVAHEWSRRGRPELAAFHFRRAIAHRRARREPRREAADRNFLGLELRRLGRSEAARRQFAKAEKLARQEGFLPGYSAAINNRGLLEEDAGHFAAARALYREAWISSPAGEAALYRENLARLLVGAGELAAAEPLLMSPDARPSAESLAERAWIELLRRRPDAALATLDQALPLARDPATRRVLDDRRGTALVQLGRFAEAAAAYRQSADGPDAASPGAAGARAATGVNLCRLHALAPAGGTAAEVECARALTAAGRSGIPGAIFASGLFWRAVQLQRGGRAGAARRSAAKALELAGRRPAGTADPARGARHFAERAGYLELAVRLAMALHRQDPRPGFDRAALADLERWRARAQGLTSVATGPQAWQQLLDDRTQVFDLVLAEPSSFLWRIRRREITSFELPGAAVLEDAARRYLALIADPRQVAQRGVAIAAGRRLAEMLFGSRLERLRDAGDRLVFLGDGALAPFPIAALPGTGASPDSPRYLVEDFEIANLPSLPSLAELRARPAGATRALALVGDPWYDARRADLRLAPLPAAAARSRLARLPAFPLGRLPFAARELDAVRAHLPRPFAALRLDGPAARRARLLADGLADFAIVHVSSHGTAEPPALWLSQVGGSRSAEGRDDGLVAGDLEGLEWQAELVVISACRGLGGEAFRFAGGGGLARGFSQAGGKRILAALWDVEGAATGELMDRFYAALLERRLEPAAALRAAQRELLDHARATGSEKQAPYYWSGFLLFGDWRGFSLP